MKKRVSHNNEESLYKISGISDKWLSKSLGHFSNDDKALEKIEAYRKNFEDYLNRGIGLYIYGKPGVGKTHLAVGLMKLLIDDGYRCRIVTFTDLITMFTDGWGNSESRKALRILLNLPSLLVIDGLGSELNSKGGEFPSKVLDNIFRMRQDAGKPLVITSQVSSKNMSRSYSESVTSLLTESMIPMSVSGSDYRLVIHRENKSLLDE